MTTLAGPKSSDPGQNDKTPVHPESPPKSFEYKYIWWTLILIVLIFNLTADRIGVKKHPEKRRKIPGPELNTHVVNFDPLPTGGRALKTVILTNRGAGPMVIYHLALKGDHADVFGIPALPMPQMLPAGENLVIPIIFAPAYPGSFTVILEMTHNADGGVEKVVLRGNSGSGVQK